jgi:hypothetical protein
MGPSGRPLIHARADALEETGLIDLPEASPFSLEQVLGET